MELITTLNDELTKIIIKHSPAYVFYIPTEIVIETPQIVCPKQGRIWSTNKWYVNDIAIPYNELLNIDGFNGTNNHNEQYIAEVWANYGDDGHTEFKIIGYIVGTIDEIEEYYYDYYRYQLNLDTRH